MATERQASPAEAGYRELVESSPDAMIIHRGGAVLYANAAVLALVGATRFDEIIGRPILSFVHEDDRAMVNLRVAAVLSGKERSAFREARIRRFDGSIVWVEAIGVVIQYGDAPAVFAVLRDITHRRLTEVALRESEERYRALVEASPDAVFVHDGRTALFANRAALKLVGARSPEDVAGTPIMNFAHEDDRALLAQRARIIVERGEAVPFLRVRVRRLDGGIVWAETAGVPVQFDGRAAVQTVMRDVTRQKA